MDWPPSDTQLDAYRLVGDPAADERVATVDDVRSLMTTMFASARLGDTHLASDFCHFPYEPPSDAVVAGQEVFADHGPEILWLLGCYALPAAYAARNGVEVLAQTGFLGARPNRRLIETTYMVVDVMTSGSLTPDGRGTDTIDRVRLMHAAIRRLILERTDPAWDTDRLGLPLNQEDMAGTLMTFSTLTIDGLKKMGIRLTAGEREAFLAAWAYIGGRMGVDPRLLPANARQAEALTAAIQRRQIDPTETSRGLMAALVPVLDDKSIPGVPEATMRHCLPRPVWQGLGLEGDWLLDGVMRTFTFIMGVVDRTFLRYKRRSRLYRALTRGLIQHLLTAGRDGGRPAFDIPDSLTWWHADDVAAPATASSGVFTKTVSRLATRGTS